MLEAMLAGGGGGRVPIKKWTTLTPAPKATVTTPMVAIEGKLYLPGGYNYTDSHYNTHQCYDIATDTWSTKAPLPFLGMNYTAVAINGKMYVYGGTLKGASAYNGALWCYDPTTNTWVACATGQNSGYHALTVHGEKLYVYSGFSFSNNNTRNYNGFRVYDPVTNTWAGLPNTPGNRAFAILVSLEGRVGLLGGYSSVSNGAGGFIDTYPNTIRRFDPSTGAWDVGTPLDLGAQNWFGDGIDDTVYVTGVANNPQCREYNTLKGLINTPSSPSSHQNGCSAVWDGKWYLFGGYMTGGVSNKLECYQPFSD